MTKCLCESSLNRLIHRGLYESQIRTSRMIGNNYVGCSYNYRRITVVHSGDSIVVILLNPGS